MRGRLIVMLSVATMLLASGCGDDSSSARSGADANRLKALETRVTALEKKLAESGSKSGAVTGGGVAELEAKLKKVAAAVGVNIAAPLATLGVMNTSKDTWKCVKVAKGPAMDGKLDDPAWKGAQQVNLKSDEAGKRIANETSVLVCHDGEKLYIGVLCMEAEMAKLHTPSTKRDDKVYRDDCIEFYIDPENDAEDCVKLVVNPNGVFQDFMRGTSGDAGDVTWNVEVKTTKLADRYFIELAIPLKDMKVKYKAGVGISFNAYRQRHGNGKKGEYSTWCGECNKIDTLGKLTFE
jgi:Carbohydrate family 9 binding domain-like